MLGEDTQTLSFRGRRSRNKVSVGEPAEGSFARIVPNNPIMIFASSATVTGDVEKMFYIFLPTFYKTFFGDLVIF